MNSIDLQSIDDQENLNNHLHSRYLGQFSNDEGTVESDIDERPEAR